jgi:hypothetical protein
MRRIRGRRNLSDRRRRRGRRKIKDQTNTKKEDEGGDGGKKE